MSDAGLFFAVILTLAVIAWVIQPFANRTPNRRREDAATLAAYQVQYERVLTNIRDLDEDYALGKIQHAFYKAERTKAVAAGTELLRLMDEHQQAASTAPPERTLDDQIEAAVAARRKA